MRKNLHNTNIVCSNVIWRLEFKFNKSEINPLNHFDVCMINP